LILKEDGTGETIFPPSRYFFSRGDQGHFPMTFKLVEGKIRWKNMIAGYTGTLIIFHNHDTFYSKICIL
jgi:hypothetical protein